MGQLRGLPQWSSTHQPTLKWLLPFLFYIPSPQSVLLGITSQYGWLSNPCFSVWFWRTETGAEESRNLTSISAPALGSSYIPPPTEPYIYSLESPATPASFHVTPLYMLVPSHGNPRLFICHSKTSMPSWDFPSCLSPTPLHFHVSVFHLLFYSPFFLYALQCSHLLAFTLMFPSAPNGFWKVYLHLCSNLTHMAEKNFVPNCKTSSPLSEL